MAEPRHEGGLGEPFEEKETTYGEFKPRHGSLYWYPLTPMIEIVVYPLLFGAARMVRGRRDRDQWQLAYDFPDVTTAVKAAEQWDGKSDPGHGWTRKIDGDKTPDSE
jgi:hypothetical protein